MADHQPLLAGRRPAVRAGNNFTVGAAYAKRQGAHQYRSVRTRGICNLFYPRRIGRTGRNGQGTHHFVPNSRAPRVARLEETAEGPAKSSTPWNRRRTCGIIVLFQALRDPESRSRGDAIVEAIGRKRWAIAEGYIPSQSSFADRASRSLMTQPVSSTRAIARHMSSSPYSSLTGTPVTYRVTVAARRTLHLRFNDLEDPRADPSRYGLRLGVRIRCADHRAVHPP